MSVVAGDRQPTCGLQDAVSHLSAQRGASLRQERVHAASSGAAPAENVECPTFLCISPFISHLPPSVIPQAQDESWRRLCEPHRTGRKHSRLASCCRQGVAASNSNTGRLSWPLGERQPAQGFH